MRFEVIFRNQAVAEADPPPVLFEAADVEMVGDEHGVPSYLRFTDGNEKSIGLIPWSSVLYVKTT